MMTGTCRVCRSPLFSILDLGTMKLPWFPRVAAQTEVPSAPLHLCGCEHCGLVQLQDTVAPDLLYRQYWYRSGINEAMRAELTDVVKKTLLEVSVYPDDLVIDVGANDGYLLSQYPKERAHWHTRRIAFEPAQNLKEVCATHCEVLVPDYFPPSDGKVGAAAGQVKILTSIAMFYDLDDPRRFVEAVDRLLHPEGVWVLQFQDLGQMIEANAIDNVCHEHLTYWSLASFIWFLLHTGCDLHVTHAELRDINGGSLRIFVRRKVYPVQPSVEDCLAFERPYIRWDTLERFAWRARTISEQIGGVVRQAHSLGYTIDLYGASTKANTLIQLAAVTPLIRQAWERNPEKFRRQTATGIPIVSEQEGRGSPPDVLLVGIWQFRDVVLQREAAFLASRGRMLFPLPEVELVTDVPAV